MARSYEYVIHGPPLSSSSLNVVPKKTLSTKRDHRRRDSDLRNLYRNSASPQQDRVQLEAIQDHRISNPATPKLPPTPPTVGDTEEQVIGESIVGKAVDAAKLVPLPVTPVPRNNPPTPDGTPPRDQLKVPIRPSLAIRPSIASTRAESFRTALEDASSEDELMSFSPELRTARTVQDSPYQLPTLNGIVDHHFNKSPDLAKDLQRDATAEDDNLPSSPTLPTGEDKRYSQNTAIEHKDTPQTQFHFDHLPNGVVNTDTKSTSGQPQAKGENHDSSRKPPFYAQATELVAAPRREASLRDRLQKTEHLRSSPSTEAFANVIGWNDGGVEHCDEPGPRTNRWSGQSNLSAVEAYVVESPIKPRKRGTLRKVVKNDSLRSTSSPLPGSNRTSLQSTSDSPHRLVHKKQKLNNDHRWSISSEISRRSLSWGSSPMWSKQEVIKVAVIPERSSSSTTSASSSQGHSHSISGASAHALTGTPPGTTALPRRKRAFSDPKERSPAIARDPQVVVTGVSPSVASSRSASRANSVSSHQFSQQREQAEKDLRSTLDRMESERLSASLRRSSRQSSSPTPTPKGLDEEPGLLAPQMVSGVRVSRKASSTGASTTSRQKSVTIDLPEITPGTKEWADLRPSTLTGTPFSQTSVMSTSPEIIEARAISFFPHNNESLQLIEPNRLSETPAVKALKGANLVPERKVNPSTPRTSGQLSANDQDTIDSPLRNPRKPPEPPQVQFSVIPPTPLSEHNTWHGASPDTSPTKTRNKITKHRRPSLQDRDHSESFIKTLGRNLSLRNAKNPKQNQQLDSTLHPLWRPRPFWDDDDYRRRMQQEREGEEAAINAGIGETDTDADADRSVTVIDPHSQLSRSNTIAAGPMSLIRRISERRQQRRAVADHLASQQALVKQTSYSSLQRLRAGRRLYGLRPVRSLSLNMGIGRLHSLREKLVTTRSRREDEKRELRREKLRKSIGPEVVMTSDSRFPDDMVIEHMGGRKLDSNGAMDQLLENARAEDLVGKRGLRL